MSTFAYEALDRTQCTISSIQVNLIEHKFYTDDEEYRNLIDKAVYAAFDDQLLELIQCERNKFENINNELVCKSAELSDLKSKNLYLEDQWLISKTKLCKIEQMGFWKRLVFIFKGVS